MGADAVKAPVPMPPMGTVPPNVPVKSSPAQPIGTRPPAAQQASAPSPAPSPMADNTAGKLPSGKTRMVTIGGQQMQIPTLAPNGREMSEDEAIMAYMITGEGGTPVEIPAASSVAGAIPPPPPGFVLDQSTASGAGAIPPPPPGFVLDDGSAQNRYDLALAKVRRSQFPDMTDEQWQQYSQTAFAPDLGTQTDQSTTLGFSDEISAAMGGIGAQLRQMTGGGGNGYGEAYGDLYELEQARLALAREQNGGLGTAVEIVSGLGAAGPAKSAAGALVPAAAQAAPKGNAAVNLVKPLVTPVATGATYGFGATDGGIQDRLAGAAGGAVIGAAGSLAAQGVGKVVEGTARRIAQAPANRAAQRATQQAIASAPSAATIKASSKAAYDAAKATGAEIAPQAISILQHDVRALLKGEGLIMPSGRMTTAYPKVNAAVEAIEEYAAGPVSIEQAQTLLKTLRRVQKSIDPDEARIGNMLVNQFEDFMDNLPPSAFPRGKGTEAIKEWSKGRSEWARFRKVQTIESLIDKAQLAKGGFDEGLRDGFRSVLRNPKKQRGFNADELAAMRKFVAGGPVGDFLGFLANGSSLPAAMTGHVFGGPVGSMVAAGGKMALGAAARAGLNRDAANAGEALRAAVATPGGLPQSPIQAQRTPLTGLGFLGALVGNIGASEPRDNLVRLMAQ
jgi:hypothetical protein